MLTALHIAYLNVLLLASLFFPRTFLTTDFAPVCHGAVAHLKDRG